MEETLDITADTVKKLREQTGAGIMDCKRALQEANGDMEKAAEALRQKGLTQHLKVAGRTANQGLIESYIHTGGRIGALVELNCETDFVARTAEFRTLAREIAMQVASMDPREVGDMGGEGDTDESALLNQSYIREPGKTIRDLVRETIGKVGENIQVSRFSRFEVGTSGAAEASQNGTEPGQE
jgi:elongation factor Ts